MKDLAKAGDFMVMATDDFQPAVTRTHPLNWNWARMSPPRLSSETSSWRGALLRVWSGTAPAMEQPPLDQHYVVMHLGGAKRVKRRGDGPAVCNVVENEALTLVPAGAANRWNTEGPIAFAHLYVPPATLESTIAREFDAEGRDTTLVPEVGCRDALLEPLLATMIDEIRRGAEASGLRLDCLYETVCRRLVVQHSTSLHRSQARSSALALAPHRLRRVLDFVESNYSRDIHLCDLAAAAGSSQSHFSHAFQVATGLSPYRYLLRARIEAAKVLLLTRKAPLDQVALQCGFHARHQFSLTFRRLTGFGPREFGSHPRRGERPVDVGEET